jgi:predicted nucleotidyltransferase
MASGSEVVLPGAAMVGLIRAVASLDEIALDGYVIVGGVAVTARLGQAHRATADVDTVIDEMANPDAIEALLALPTAEADPTGAHSVKVAGTKVEMIGVGSVDDDSFDGMTELQTLFIAAHTWALSTATPLTLVAEADRTVRGTGPFATPAALVAMKLHAIQDRRLSSGQDKRGSDAWDLYRLLVDLDADGSLRGALTGAPAPLRSAVRAAAQRILIDNAARTRGWMAAADDQMGRVTADELRYLAEPVVDSLS